MKRYIIALLLLIPMISHAEIPAISKLGKEASKQENVEHTSVGRFMLGLAALAAEEQESEIFKMLDNIEMIECTNKAYSPKLLQSAKAIIEKIGAELIDSQDDGEEICNIYIIGNQKIIKELIIIIESHNAEVAIMVMSGEIPVDRLAEVAKMKS